MKKKLVISKLWLYRYRFILGYSLLGLAFVATVALLPLITPGGLSEAEMQSAVQSTNIHFNSIVTGGIIDLPYHVLQNLSIAIFGLTAYAIKLPSILIGLALGLLFILILNRWFKSNVAIFASVISVFSAPFLYLAGSGTPLIMLVFWPTLLLWLGSKIQGKTAPNPVYCFIFAFALLLSIFTPHLIYLAIFIVIFALVQPHLRFTIKNLPKIPLIATIIIILGGLAAIISGLISHPQTIETLLLMPDFSITNFFANLGHAFTPIFAWGGNVDSVFLSPMLGLASVALALIGLFSTARGFLASRNAIATFIIIFTIILSGFNPDSAILIILPVAILIAHGLRYILDKWYGLFPENPYARIFAIVPITIFLGIIIISDLSHFIFGYRYNPVVADHFSTDLAIVEETLTDNATLLIPTDTTQYNFFKILDGQSDDITVLSELPADYTGSYATLGKWDTLPQNSTLTRIITSPKSDNSDRIYLYEISQN